jgi:hypothetical protein
MTLPFNELGLLINQIIYGAIRGPLLVVLLFGWCKCQCRRWVIHQNVVDVFLRIAF